MFSRLRRFFSKKIGPSFDDPRLDKAAGRFASIWIGSIMLLVMMPIGVTAELIDKRYPDAWTDFLFIMGAIPVIFFWGMAGTLFFAVVAAKIVKMQYKLTHEEFERIAPLSHHSKIIQLFDKLIKRFVFHQP